MHALFVWWLIGRASSPYNAYCVRGAAIVAVWCPSDAYACVCACELLGCCWMTVCGGGAYTVHAQVLGKLKSLGNTILGKFGLSLDNFKMKQDPATGGYSMNFQQ